MDSAESPVKIEYMSTVNVSVFARPMRSPTDPKMSPPVAQPATKIAVAYPPYSFASQPGGSRVFIAAPRARMKRC